MRTKQDTPVAIRLRFGPEARLGPGKIALLEALDSTGSVASAGASLGMSHRRALLLLDSLNAMFTEPVFAAAEDGHERLTALGHALVGAYRAAESDATAAIARHFAPLQPRMVTAGAADDEGDGQHPPTARR